MSDWHWTLDSFVEEFNRNGAGLKATATLDNKLRIESSDQFYAVENEEYSGSNGFSTDNVTISVLDYSALDFKALDIQFVRSSGNWGILNDATGGVAQIIPAGADDLAVYVKSATTLFAVDPLSGEDIWAYQGGDFVSLPAVTATQLYVIARAGGLAQIRGLSRLDGKEEWHMESAALSNAAPIVAGDYLFVRTTDGRIVGFYSEEE